MKRYRLSLTLAQRSSIGVANRVIDEITNRFPLLAAMPESGRSRPEVELGLYSFPVHDYLIYYRKSKRGGILISRVIHGRRDHTKAIAARREK